MTQIDAGELITAFEIPNVFGHPGLSTLAVASLHCQGKAAWRIDDTRASLCHFVDHRRKRGLEQLDQGFLCQYQRGIPARLPERAKKLRHMNDRLRGGFSQIGRASCRERV